MAGATTGATAAGGGRARSTAGAGTDGPAAVSAASSIARIMLARLARRGDRRPAAARRLWTVGRSAVLWTQRRSGVQPGEPLGRLEQHRVLLAEREPDQRAAGVRVVV